MTFRIWVLPKLATVASFVIYGLVLVGIASSVSSFAGHGYLLLAWIFSFLFVVVFLLGIPVCLFVAIYFICMEWSREIENLEHVVKKIKARAELEGRHNTRKEREIIDKIEKAREYDDKGDLEQVKRLITLAKKDIDTLNQK